MTEKYGSLDNGGGMAGVARNRGWRSLVLGRAATLCGAQQRNSLFYFHLLVVSQPDWESGSRGVGMLGLITEQTAA